jgi:hypothetical protein
MLIFLAINSDEDFISMFVFGALASSRAPDTLFSGSSEAPGVLGVIGIFDVRDWDGDLLVPAPVAESGTLALFGLGLLGLGLTRRRAN